MKVIDVDPPLDVQCDHYSFLIPRPIDWTQPLGQIIACEVITMRRLDVAYAEVDRSVVARIWQGYDEAGNMYQTFIGEVTERPDWWRRNQKTELARLGAAPKVDIVFHAAFRADDVSGVTE